MTSKEELMYLLDLQAECTKWQIEPPDNAYELEVRERIKNLVERLRDRDDPAVVTKNVKDSKARYKESHVRVHENGKVTWVKKEDAEQIQTNNGFKWVRKSAGKAEVPEEGVANEE